MASCIALEGSGAMVGVPSMDESKLGNSPKARLRVRRHTNLVLGRPSTVSRSRVDVAQVVGSESRVIWSTCEESGSQFQRRDWPNSKRGDQHYQ